VPNLGGMNTALSGDILGQLSGNITPATLAALRNAAATWGVGSGTGMGVNGLGDLAQNSLFGNVAGFAENQVNKGVQNYNSTIPTISSTQTLSPALQLQAALANMGAQNQAGEFNTNVAATNATNAAAPNPAMAQSYAQQLFDKYMNSMRSPSGATGSTGSPAGGSTSTTTGAGDNYPARTAFPPSGDGYGNANGFGFGLGGDFVPGTGTGVVSDSGFGDEQGSYQDIYGYGNSDESFGDY